jgi:hypothetical protein
MDFVKVEIISFLSSFAMTPSGRGHGQQKRVASRERNPPAEKSSSLRPPKRLTDGPSTPSSRRKETPDRLSSVGCPARFPSASLGAGSCSTADVTSRATATD